MKEVKEMKNIKVPSYACKMENGNFAGADWQCKYCGKIVKGYSSQPYSGGFGKCPESNSGNHAFFQI